MTPPKHSLLCRAKMATQVFFNCACKAGGRKVERTPPSLASSSDLSTADTNNGLVPTMAETSDLKETSPQPSLSPTTNSSPRAFEGRPENLKNPNELNLKPEAEAVHGQRLGAPFKHKIGGKQEYTDCATRLITVSDSTKTHLALQMSLDLIQKIQTAVVEQRETEELEPKIKTEQAVFHKLRSDLLAVIANQEAQLRELQDFEAAVAEIEQCQDMLRRLKVLKRDVEKWPSIMQRLLVGEWADLRCLQGEVGACLEAAFLDANLLQPHKNRPDGHPISRLSIDDDIAELLKTSFDRRDVSDDDSSVAPEEEKEQGGDKEQTTECERESEEPTPEHAGSHASPLDAAYHEGLSTEDLCWHAYEEYLTALQNFDRRDTMRDAQYDNNARAVANGEKPEDATVEAFDVRMVRVYQSLTRRVIDTEEEMRRALVKAAREGVEVSLKGMDDFDLVLEGAFVNGDDGYAESVELELVQSAPVDQIFKWMRGVPAEADVDDEATAEDREDADEWEVEELRFGDDSDTYAVGRDKSMIEKWLSMVPSAPVDEVVE